MCCSMQSRTRPSNTGTGMASISTVPPMNPFEWVLDFGGLVGSSKSWMCSDVMAMRSKWISAFGACRLSSRSMTSGMILPLGSQSPK